MPSIRRCWWASNPADSFVDRDRRRCRPNVAMLRLSNVEKGLARILICSCTDALRFRWFRPDWLFGWLQWLQIHRALPRGVRSHRPPPQKPFLPESTESQKYRSRLRQAAMARTHSPTGMRDVGIGAPSLRLTIRSGTLVMADVVVRRCRCVSQAMHGPLNHTVTVGPQQSAITSVQVCEFMPSIAKDRCPTC